MPVRQVANRGGNASGKFPSLKMNRMIAFESLIERDYLCVLDYEVEVLAFTEQPLTITYQDGAQEQHYTPDFHLVCAGNRHVLGECKPQTRVETAANQRKFRAARAWCAEQEWEFRVITDAQLRAGPRLPNIKLLTYYARLAVPPQIVGQILHTLTTTAGWTIGGLAHALAPHCPNSARPWIMHLAFHHAVELPLEAAPLSGQTLISWPRPEVPR